jgi:hypothetical protein
VVVVERETFGTGRRVPVKIKDNPFVETRQHRENISNIGIAPPQVKPREPIRISPRELKKQESLRRTERERTQRDLSGTRRVTPPTPATPTVRPEKRERSVVPPSAAERRQERVQPPERVRTTQPDEVRRERRVVKEREASVFKPEQPDDLSVKNGTNQDHHQETPQQQSQQGSRKVKAGTSGGKSSSGRIAEEALSFPHLVSFRRQVRVNPLKVFPAPDLHGKDDLGFAERKVRREAVMQYVQNARPVGRDDAGHGVQTAGGIVDDYFKDADPAAGDQPFPDDAVDDRKIDVSTRENKDYPLVLILPPLFHERGKRYGACAFDNQFFPFKKQQDSAGDGCFTDEFYFIDMPADVLERLLPDPGDGDSVRDRGKG